MAQVNALPPHRTAPFAVTLTSPTVGTGRPVCSVDDVMDNRSSATAQ